METITLTFPQVKVNLGINDITFDTLENTVFDITQQIGKKVLEKALYDIDDKLRQTRQKGTIKNTGKRPKYLLTRLDDIRYRRTRYKDKEGNTRYFLNERLSLEKSQRISLSRAKIEMLIATIATCRGTKQNVELLTGCTRSHEAIRQSVIKEAKRIIAHQRYSITLLYREEEKTKSL